MRLASRTAVPEMTFEGGFDTFIDGTMTKLMLGTAALDYAMLSYPVH